MKSFSITIPIIYSIFESEYLKPEFNLNQGRQKRYNLNITNILETLPDQASQ